MQPRPTHHDAWHRIATTTPRLRSSVNTTRQRFRGRRWIVVEDAAANQHFRISQAAYAFIGLLDGNRTAQQALDACQSRLADNAPTEAEALRVLAQLAHGNLLAGDVPQDAIAVARRTRQRNAREIRSKLASFLFVRIPLADPDALLNDIHPATRFAYTPAGAIAWLALLITAAVNLLPELPAFRDQAAGVIEPANLPLLATVFIATKILHEIGHGAACKAMAAKEHPRPAPTNRAHPAGTSAGEVHTLGVMLLALFPVPYVDTSSAWNIRSKWRRIVINAAGMHAELAIAAVAALVFAATTPGTTANAIAHNTIILAGVTTLLFNANPLLRYDGYYILADLTETPNLASRARDTLLAIIRRHALGVRTASPPAASTADQTWLTLFGIASMLYRAALTIVIIWFVSNQFLIIGVLLAIAAVGTFFLLPLARAIRYLTTSDELATTRPRALAVSLGTAAAATAAATLLPVPDTTTIPGIVTPAHRETVFATEHGTITEIAQHSTVLAPGDTVLRIHAPDLTAASGQVAARLTAETIRRRTAIDANDPAEASSAKERIDALTQQLDDLNQRTAALHITATAAQRWLAPDARTRVGANISSGDPIGQLINPDSIEVVALAGQTTDLDNDTALIAPPIIAPAGRPATRTPAESFTVSQSTSDALPSSALTYEHNGPIRPATAPGATATASPAARSADQHFTVRLTPQHADNLYLGERVWVRFQREPKPIAQQATRLIRQLFQRRAVNP